MALVVTVAGVRSRSDQPTFCHLGQAIISNKAQVYDDLAILDFSYGARMPCGDDDLHGFRSSDLVGVDGVLFNDCVISWTDGGRTPAAEVGVPCDG